MAKDKWADRDYVLKAVKEDGKALERAAKSLQADREVVLEAVKENADALKRAAVELRNDPELQRIAERYHRAQELAREWTEKHSK